jgi:hypothetical protein
MEPSRWHMTLVYFGYRSEEGAPPTEEDRDVIRARRVTAVSGAVLVVALVVASLLQ